MDREIPFQFQGVPFGTFEKISPLVTKCRLRIFYLGLNRNGGFITQEFADKLLATLPYVPIVGIYDSEEGDFTSHSQDPNDANTYGVVPENPNVSWETNADEDGVERTYATCDVYLLTGRYDVAKEIIGKSQSLELDRRTIKGEWKVLGSDYAFVYTDAAFIGLSVLGDKVEPCFEGSAFYNVISSYALALNALVAEIEKNKNNNGGTQEMELVNYRLSHDEVYSGLFRALNSNFTEEGGWDYNYELVKVYDDYVLTYKCKQNNYARVYYSKDNDNITIGDEVEVKIVDVTLEECALLEKIKANYSLETLDVATINAKLESFSSEISDKDATIAERDATIGDKDTEISSYSEKISEKDSKIVELENSISTYEVEATDLKAERDGLVEKLTAFENEKALFEKQQKEAMVSSYENFVSSEHVADLTAKIDQYDLERLEEKLSYFALKDKPQLLNRDLIPSGESAINNNSNGIVSILERYKNK